MDTAHHDDLVIVGAGVIGLSVALVAARCGLRVSLLDPDPARGASWVAAGMLAAGAEATWGEEALAHVLRQAMQRWPHYAAFVSECSGMALGYEQQPTVVVGLTRGDRLAIDDALAFHRQRGWPVEALSPVDARRHIPALQVANGGGALLFDDHQVDNRRLLSALLAAAAANDAVTVLSTPVTDLLCNDGTVVGVRSQLGVHRASTVVLAAGWQSARLAGELWTGALRPVKGQLLRLATRDARRFAPGPIRLVVNGRHSYLVARADGEVVLGASEEERGEDRAIEAGTIFGLLDDARRLIPSVDDLVVVELCSGLRPGTPDNLPYLGPSGTPGLAVATGHYRNGLVLAPLSAELVVSWCLGDPWPEWADNLRGDRRQRQVAT